MKFARKLCSLLLVVMMVMTVCPVTALAANQITTTTAMVEKHFNQLKKMATDGKFFTTGDGSKPCYLSNHRAEDCSSSSGKPYCNVAAVCTQNWLLNYVDYKPGSTSYLVKQYYPSGGTGNLGDSCFGFACYAMWYIYSTAGNQDIIGTLSTVSTYNKESVAKIVQQGQLKKGNIIRFSGGHSVIFDKIDPNGNGIYVLDCNWNNQSVGSSKIQYHIINYDNPYYKGNQIAVTCAGNVTVADQPTTYTVSYNANGGSGAPSAQTKTKDVSLTLSTTRPTRAGYNFLGWATSSSAVSAQYQPGSTYTANANVTLYAVWEELNTIAINAANFPDANFRAVVSTFDKNGDGKLNETEIAAVTKIDCSKKNISSLKGIEHFTALTELRCSNNRLTTLDVSKNVALERLDCDCNQLTTLDVSNNTALTNLDCDSNQLTALDVSKNTALDVLQCDCNHLTTLDVSRNTALTHLSCDWNQLTALDVSKNMALEWLFCHDNQLTTLDVSNNTALKNLACGGKHLTALDVSKNTRLENLSCYNSNLTTLNVSKNTALEILDCGINQLTTLDVSNNTALTGLWCYENQLTTLDVSRNTALTTLSCWGNQLTALDVSKNTALKEWSCGNNSYDITLNASRSYDLSKLPGSFDASKAKAWNGCTIQGSVIKVNAGVNKVSYTYDCGNGKTMPVTLNVVGVEAPSATYTVTYRSNTGDVSVCTNIPDTKEYSLDSIVTLPEKIPTRPNGKFMYWQEANTNKLYQPGNTVTIKGNMELVAIWALDWSHEKNGLFVGIDCVSVTPGETVDIPVFINYESRAVLSLEGEYSSFEYETETGGPLPKFVRYIPKEKPEKTMPGCYVIGIARYDIPKDLNLAGKYYFHLDNISDLTILDENGPLVVIRNNVYPASGEQAKARNGWTLNTPEATTFTVRFNANGGYGSMAAVSNVSGPYTLPSCTFEAPSEKQFKGWAVSPNGNVITGNSYNITADTTFYAVWEQQEVTGCCLEVGKMVATHGKEVLVPISISQNPGFAGINVKIDYDKTRLQFIGSGDIAGLDWTVNTGDNAGAVMVSTKNYTKNGEILLLKFKVLEDAPDGFAKVSLFNADVLSIDEKTISVTLSSGGVEVITRLPGDVTGDGMIDTRDALRLKKHLAGLDAPIVWQNADVTGDNDVTLADLLRLMKYLAGMQVELV